MDKYIVRLKVKPPNNLYFVAQAANEVDIKSVLKQVLIVYGKSLPILNGVNDIESIEIWDVQHTKVFSGTADFEIYVVSPKRFQHIPLKQVKGIKSAYTAVCRQIKSETKAMFIGYKSELVSKPKLEQVENKVADGIYKLSASYKQSGSVNTLVKKEDKKEHSLEHSLEPRVEPKVEPQRKPKPEVKKLDLYSRVGANEQEFRNIYEKLKLKLNAYYTRNCVVDVDETKQLGYFYGVIVFDTLVSQSLGIDYGITGTKPKSWCLVPWVDILNTSTFNTISPINVEGATKEDAVRWSKSHPLVFKDFETVKRELYEAFEKSPIL